MSNPFITPKQQFFAKILLALWTILWCQLLDGVAIAFGQDGNAGLSQATSMVQGYFSTACNLMYAIGAVIAIVGGVKVFQKWSEVLEVLYEAAALCINTIRTFQLIVLAILGPLVFGLAVFDGFQHTLTVWMARYINVFLWLPVANIFGSIIGKVQQNMLSIDIAQIQSTGNTFFNSTDLAYLVFLLIGIVGYFTVPSTANYIVHAGGGNALVQKINSLVSSSSRAVGSAMSGSVGGMQADAYGNQRENTTQSYSTNSESEGYFKDKLSGNPKNKV